jgi:hypothetical protein
VGCFDKPGQVSLSEELVKASGAGAIASFSATRSCLGPNNTSLALGFYGSIFDSTEMTIGMAMVSAKSKLTDDNNDVYVIMGDPSYRPFMPARTVRLALADSSGKTIASDTLMALQPITIKGSVFDASGNIDASFGSLATAYVQLGLFNAPEIATRKDGGGAAAIANGGNPNPKWLAPGKPVFIGKTQVRDGVFQQTALLPRDISFDEIGSRLIAYAWDCSKIGLGEKNTMFHGTAPVSSAMKKDSVGPQITIKPLYDINAMNATQASFTDHIVSSLPLNCELDINDPSGIDVTGAGPDEGLTMEIPGVLSRRNINEKFKFSEGDYRKGTAVLSFEENSLKTGTYSLVVTAQDMLGNVAKSTFSIQVTDAATFSLDHVFNSPNPMRMGGTTQIFFYPSSTTTQNTNPPLEFGVVIKIYSLSGRLLRVIKNAGNGEIWDGRDQTGYQLPPNIYLYQVTAWYPQQDKQVQSKIEKIVMHPPK